VIPGQGSHASWGVLPEEFFSLQIIPKANEADTALPTMLSAVHTQVFAPHQLQ
jgi:hypothetical protein